MNWVSSSCITDLKRDFFEDATRKDGGLDPGMIALRLESLPIQELPDYLVKPVTLDELRSFAHDLRNRMAALALPKPS